MNKMSKLLVIICLSIVSINHGKTQLDNYDYRIPIHDASEGWNAINLPLDIYDKIKPDLSDLRIYSITSTNDKPLEQPYLLDVQTSKTEVIKADFKIINTTRTGNQNAYTFELSNKVDVNKIHLDFSNQNFDWNLKIEGSMDQNTWSTITSNKRIISLKNGEVDFKYTDIPLPDSKFNFYRVSFPSAIKPDLIKATLSKEVYSESNYNSYPVLWSKTEENGKIKSTIIELDLGIKLPIGQLEVLLGNTNDFYRPIKIEGVIDSFETEKGWRYRYKVLYKGTVNSFSPNKFKFKESLVQRLRISIRNYDNRPLIFMDYKVKGPNYRLISRFDQSENLYLVYGNDDAKRPIYDITFFKDKIPEDLNITSLGKSEYLPKGTDPVIPLFKNKWWLWAIMIIIILLLGTFTLRMLKEEK